MAPIDDTTEPTGCALGLAAAALVIAFPAALIYGWTLSVLWGWFMVPALGLAQLPVVPAIGLALTVRFLIADHRDLIEEKRPAIEKLLGLLVRIILHPSFTLGFGWIVLQFMED